MVRTFNVIGMIFLFIISTHAQFTDDFSDGDFMQNPEWNGDTSLFEVSTTNQLHLNAPAVDGKAKLSVKSNAVVNATWEFWFSMEFNPSSTNYLKVFIMADCSNADSVDSGYYLKIGGTNDDLCLYKRTGSSEVLLINGRDKIFNSTAVKSRIRVSRDNSGNWELFCDTTGAKSFQSLGQANDSSVLTSQFFIFQCIYTSTRSTRFYFDDIVVTGQPYTDGSRPTLKSFKVLSDKEIELAFSESVIADTSGYRNGLLLNSSIFPDSIVYDKEMPVTIKVFYPVSFLCEVQNNLSIASIKDQWGNAIIDTSIVFSYCSPVLFDVVFNEVMADPIPSYSLPESEYLELYNRSSKSFRTDGWQLNVGSSIFLFSDTSFLPGEYLVVTSKAGVANFAKFGKVLGLFNSSTELNNSGEVIILKNKIGNILSFLEYSDSWYGDEFKSDGGWSLEQVDPFNPCNGQRNWKASINKSGGTPGQKNSVYNESTDNEGPKLERIFVSSDSSLLLTFSEPVLHINTTIPGNFTITPDLGTPEIVGFIENDYSKIELKYTQKIVSDVSYTLHISEDIADCCGNSLANPIDTIFTTPQAMDSADIVINEVLFDAYPGCTEYIELYNRSAKILNGGDLLITLIDGETSKTNRISIEGFLFFPGSYLVLSESPELLANFYNIKNEYSLQKVTDLGSLNDESGEIRILNRDLKNMDVFKYSKNMHLPTLRNVEGISLERVNISVPTNFAGNWHSAAETVGYGTPGYENSQLVDEASGTKVFSVENELFSPDNDGYHDVLNIEYNLNTPGNRVSAIIYNTMGVKIRHLLNNTTIETQGSFTWDGVSDNGNMCTPGMYLVLIRCVHGMGSVKEYKIPCVLAIRK
jgi:hypothetical protein